MQNFYVPRTKNVGHPVELTDAQKYDLPGVSREDEHYVKAGVPIGRRRKHITITLGSAVQGKVLLYNKVSGQLLAIITGVSSAGTGYVDETDDDLYIQYSAAGTATVTSINGTSSNIAVKETFYLE